MQSAALHSGPLRGKEIQTEEGKQKKQNDRKTSMLKHAINALFRFRHTVGGGCWDACVRKRTSQKEFTCVI